MTELRIRDVDAAVVEQLKDCAKRHGHTLGDEVRSILAAAVARPRLEMSDRLGRLRSAIQPLPAGVPDSTAYIREERDRHG
ncbi:MAG: hypothetical protein QM754_07955 [Tepidisphaeraceae bacterium]